MDVDDVAIKTGDLLIQRFNGVEISELAMKLKIDLSNIVSDLQNKTTTARQLVSHYRRRGGLGVLLSAMAERPDLNREVNYLLKQLSLAPVEPKEIPEKTVLSPAGSRVSSLRLHAHELHTIAELLDRMANEIEAASQS